jgi:hypothetical protein
MHFKIQNGIITEVNVKEEESNSDTKANGVDKDSGYDFQDEIIPF